MAEPLIAYVAGALTALMTEDPRALYESAAERLREHGFTPYVPHLATDPVRHPDVSPEAVYERDRAAVASADLMLAFLGSPSLGVGQELEIAANALVPAVIAAPVGTAISRMALGGPLLVLAQIRYESVEDLNAQLKRVLPRIADEVRLRARRMAAPVGAEIARLRVARGMSRQELARRVGAKASYIRAVETSVPLVSNPSAVFLVNVARALGASAADLVGTGAETPLIASLHSYAAARQLSADDVTALIGVAARGMRAEQALTVEEWDRIRGAQRIPAGVEQLELGSQ